MFGVLYRVGAGFFLVFGLRFGGMGLVGDSYVF